GKEVTVPRMGVLAQPGTGPGEKAAPAQGPAPWWQEPAPPPPAPAPIKPHPVRSAPAAPVPVALPAPRTKPNRRGPLGLAGAGALVLLAAVGAGLWFAFQAGDDTGQADGKVANEEGAGHGGNKLRGIEAGDDAGQDEGQRKSKLYADA